MAKRKMSALQRKYFGGGKRKGARKAKRKGARKASRTKPAARSSAPAVRYRTRTIVKRVGGGGGSDSLGVAFKRRGVKDRVVETAKLAGGLVAGAAGAVALARTVGGGSLAREAVAVGVAGALLGGAAGKVSRMVGGVVSKRTVQRVAAGMIADAGMRATATLRAAGKIPFVSRTNRGLLAGVGVVDPNNDRNAGFSSLNNLAD